MLIWNTIPISNNAPADFVLGQTTMLTNMPDAGSNAISAAGLYMPVSVYAAGNFIAVADYGNHRVLVWTSPITANGQAADFVLGQPDASSNVVNAGGKVTSATMANPCSVAGDTTHLVISDRFNQRLLVYSPLPTATGAAASFALGQPELTSNRINDPGEESRVKSLHEGHSARMRERDALQPEMPLGTTLVARQHFKLDRVQHHRAQLAVVAQHVA